MDIIKLEIMLIILIAIAALIIVGYFLNGTLIAIHRRKTLQDKLESIMEALKLQPSEKEYFADKMLVLDITNKLVVYLDYFNFEKVTLIDLEDLKECRLKVRGLVVRLDLIFHSSYKEKFSIIFYRRFVDPNDSRCRLTATARRWNELLLQSIESRKEFDYRIQAHSNHCELVSYAES